MTYPPPPVPASAGTGQPRLRGRIPLRLAIIFLVLGIAGIVAGGVVLATQSAAKVNKFTRIHIAQSSSTITSGHVKFGTGGYIAYYESAQLNEKQVPIVPIRLTSPTGKQIIPTTLYGGENIRNHPGGTHNLGGLTYDFEHHHGTAVWQFNISEAGLYKVEVQGEPNAPAGSDMAFGRSIGKSTAVGAALIVVGALLFVVGVILLIIGLVKRSRSKKELAAAGSGAPYGGFGAPMYGQPGGQQPPPYGQQPGYGTQRRRRRRGTHRHPRRPSSPGRRRTTTKHSSLINRPEPSDTDGSGLLIISAGGRRSGRRGCRR